MKRIALALALLIGLVSTALAAVNINTATKEELDTLKGIGPVKAQAIVDYQTKFLDNGPEFTAQPFVDWCAEHGVAPLYIQPGKPDQNAYIERFNRSYRTEVLNAHLFESIAELRAVTNQWLGIYNRERPHDSLGRVPPLTFLPRLSSAEQSPIELSA